MENDILDAFKDIGYENINSEKLENAVAEGPKSIEYTRLVEWLSKELKLLCNLDEHVNAITSPDDSSSFLLEVSSFLKELGCQYGVLTEGNVNQRLMSRDQRLLLLDFLLSELAAARILAVDRPDPRNTMEVTLQESSTAADLKNLLIALKFPKPPANITPGVLFGKVEIKTKEVISKAPPALIGKPLFTGILSDKQWHQVKEIETELHKEYRMRREMLLKRLDVTIQSFGWSDRIKNQQDRIVAVYGTKRNAMKVEPDVDLADLLAARDDLAILEKTSSASVRKHTQSSINKVMIGRVPDRGGRPSEQQPPPPEMPSWQQRPGGSGGGGRGGGGGGFQGGGDRGGRVQGGWNQGGGGFQGGGYQNRGGHSGGYQDQRGKGGYHDNRGDRGGGYHQDNRGYQDNRGGYQDRGYQDRGGYHGSGRGGRGGHHGGGGGRRDRY